MADSATDEAFYASFGDFPAGYDRDEAAAGMREAFRRRQRQRQRRRGPFVEERLLGAGLGGPAEGTVRAATYEPQTVLSHVAAEAKEEKDKSNKNNNGSEGESGKEHNEKGAGASEALRRVMRRYGGHEAEVRSFADVHVQLETNLRVAEESIAQGCSPFSFDELTDTLDTALRIAEEGDAACVVKLPTRDEALHGAEAVMAYVHSDVLLIVTDLVTVLYATAWMLQYTMTFIDALIATSMEEAQMRLELLAHCVRWLGKIDRFISVSLALELKWGEYNAFNQMRASAELYIGDLIDGVETDLQEVVQSVQFPHRRQRLLEVEEKIKTHLHHAVALLNEIDCNFFPQVRLQVEWKDEFVSRMFRRVYVDISPVFFFASLGFIDETLYVKTNGGRRLSFVRNKKETSTARSGNTPIVDVHTRDVPGVLTASQVRYHRVDEGLTFQRIAIIVRGVTSGVVGLQLCMGARYVLRQSDQAHDAEWGFAMNEPQDPRSVEQEAVVAVTQFTNFVKKKVRRRMVRIAEGKCVPLFT